MTDAPPSSTWIVAVHDRKNKDSLLGAGVVIDAFRVLTCAHVVGARPPSDLGVAFPRATDPYQPLAAVGVVKASGHELADVAVLELTSPLPDGVEPARLRRPKGVELLPNPSWWAFGFPRGDRI